MNDLTPLDTSWLLICAFLVTTMQIGFCALESGMVRQKNSINVAFKNLMDFVVAGLVFWLVGYGLMFGAGSANGLFGTDLFLRSHADGNTAFFVYQMVFCSAAATIVGGALAERTKLTTYLLISALMAALFYPLMGHWAWGGTLENGTPGWLAARGFIDFAGGSVVHGTGGWLALAAVIIIGPRIGRFDSTKPLLGSNYTVATIGVLMLWFGWFGFNGGSNYRFDANVANIIVNTSLSAAAGAMTLLSFAWIRKRKPDVVASLNGTLAGLVGVTAGCHLYETTDAIAVGIICAAACGLAMHLLERLRIDDVIGAWPAHAVAGGVGTLLVALLGDSAAFPLEHGRVEQLMVQATGVVTVALWGFGGGFVVLWILNRVIPLRVSAEDEMAGLNVSEHGASTDLLELLGEMNSQGQEGDFTTPVAVEPHTEVGQIASEYNRVLERVRIEIETREEAYRQLEEASEFRFIFENTHEGIVQFARDGQVLKANPAAAALLGFASDIDLVQRAGRWLARLDNIDRTNHVKTLKILEARGVARDIELTFTRQVDGRTAYVQLDLRRVIGRDGAPTTVIGSIIDISERKANDRLRVERDAATAASHAKSEFLANMSHEIRTPLNGVTGMLELLGRTELDARQQRFVNIAGTSANALLSVINDILDVSKIEAGKLELERTAFTLPDLLADVVDMFAPQAATKGIELASLVPGSIPARVIGDPERLRQVLVNLLGNAIKFTEKGAVTLRCSTTRLGRDEAAFRIDVEDSGPGISPSELDRLFQPFTQADSSTTRKHGGTGLGLTITRQLVGLMGGDITVESEPGKGTTFHVDIPLPLAEPVDPAPHGRGRTKAEAAGREGLKVLAVDDHAVNLELLKGLLEPEGYEVGCVGGAESALSELTRAHSMGNPYRLALLDFQMPGTDGEELARSIRADSRFDDLLMVMLTSIDQAIPTAERARLRILASITKPLRRSRLFDAIDEALGNSRGTPASPALASSAASARGLSTGQTTGLPTPEVAAPASRATPTANNTPTAIDANEAPVADSATNTTAADVESASDSPHGDKPTGESPDAVNESADTDSSDMADGASGIADAIDDDATRDHSPDTMADGDSGRSDSPGSDGQDGDGQSGDRQVGDSSSTDGSGADSSHADSSGSDTHGFDGADGDNASLDDTGDVDTVSDSVSGGTGSGNDVAEAAPDEDRSLNILVVEDNPVNQMVTEELLLAAGHVVMVADNGAEALDHIESAGDIEMVLMDCQMPVMDGFEATRRLRAIEAKTGGPRLPVIAVTANAIKGDRERCIEAGMDDYVSKPIDVKLLEAAIRKHARNADSNG